MEKTIVVFRKWPGVDGEPAGGVIALFPGIPECCGMCASYEHVGQHGPAHYPNVIRLTVPATPEEYADLKTELESIGYHLDVRKRRGKP